MIGGSRPVDKVGASSGDDTRAWPATVRSRRRPPTSDRSLRRPERAARCAEERRDRRVDRHLAADSDVVVGLHPGDRGLRPLLEELERADPALVSARSPARRRRRARATAIDLLVQALDSLIGVARRTEEPAEDPGRPRSTSSQASPRTVGILGAFRHREATGEGHGIVSISLLGCRSPSTSDPDPRVTMAQRSRPSTATPMRASLPTSCCAPSRTRPRIGTDRQFLRPLHGARGAGAGARSPLHLEQRRVRSLRCCALDQRLARRLQRLGDGPDRRRVPAASSTTSPGLPLAAAARPRPDRRRRPRGSASRSV